MEFVRKRCFYTRKDGTKGVLVHKSVVLKSGIVVRFGKNGYWKITHPERLDTAVATSLSRYAMCTAQLKGRMRSDVEEFATFPLFQERAAKLMNENDFVALVAFLGGK